MTGYELKQTVTEMGFARCLEENEEYFFRAANYALSSLARAFSLSGEVCVDYTPDSAYYKDYCLTLICPAFRMLPEGSISVDGVRLTEGRDYLVSDGTLRIAKRPAATLTVRYLRAPRRLTPESMEAPLDTVPVAEHLIPLLAASFLWLEDRPELAAHYLSLYRAEAEEIKQAQRHHTAAYRVKNGWDKA